MNSPILAPAAVLILWSMLVLLYMVATRFPAFKRAGLDPNTAEPGAQYRDLEPVIEPRVNWVSHNYTHLMEQPTIFYACVLVLALAGAGEGINLMLAWCYVGLRVLHSLWQIFVNVVKYRIMIFATSSTVLLVLAINAVRATL